MSNNLADVGTVLSEFNCTCNYDKFGKLIVGKKGWFYSFALSLNKESITIWYRDTTVKPYYFGGSENCKTIKEILEYISFIESLI